MLLIIFKLYGNCIYYLTPPTKHIIYKLDLYNSFKIMYYEYNDGVMSSALTEVELFCTCCKIICHYVSVWYRLLYKNYITADNGLKCVTSRVNHQVWRCTRVIVLVFDTS